jgi:predicted lipoprotein with Yx(FWY)xxD motif
MSVVSIKSVTLTAGLIALGLTYPATAQTAVPAKSVDSSKGKILVDGSGMTLYHFDNDPAGKSVCNAPPCSVNWLPFHSTGNSTGSWTAISREDGSKQWAYNGMPLYTFAKDAKPGDMTGDAFMNNEWHIAHP